jgi:predicted AAA+ superfamily ATPase
MFQRPIRGEITKRLAEPRRFIQVLAGPRQVGKTTLAEQVLAVVECPGVYASADGPTLADHAWIEEHWSRARHLCQQSLPRGGLLVLDEVHKVRGWSEMVKRLWDEDTRSQLPLKVLLLGSSPFLVQRGLSESLAGRLETIHISHWPFSEMEAAFGWTVEQYVYFGGYPGAAPLIEDLDRWRHYISESLVETTLSRDVLLMTRVDKPALLRRLFQLGCDYSGQVLSYQKMLGQLQERGNTTTLAHYLDLLSGVGMISGLQKFSGQMYRRRASSPKLLTHNTALMTAPTSFLPATARENAGFWGRLVETAVGAHLLGATVDTSAKVFYWRERNHEVDYILQQGEALVAIEVKSGRRRSTLPGMVAFDRAFCPTHKLLVGGQGIALDEFLRVPAGEWLVR